ncbi:DNA phosphorothioation system sulfurtransferase DndC [Microcoleus sp. FACHB-68]|uniref:DNA phosphorothioation system sulfurtransferase DndC n=1 Tax=Microcoleus sp. FACHB-68 TaxID=2692826 RepID=UPI001685E072|nr:DNA phosphorothioation system sulfurtransferase DndC [Microcoleus sp. FACHB-68]MBD1936327.1 DNA phosphorothioation system sulfurtransferase DndC [Microcoleus sp. FACHB-68]
MAREQESGKNQERSIVADLVEDIQSLTTEIQELYCSDEIPWVIGYSGGKDSTAVVQLIWNAISALPSEKRNKTIHVITTDTLVENPIVSAWVNNSLKQMKVAAQEQEMPIQPHLLYPEIKESFWVCLIGKGYPAPRMRFRWCTERLKIQPANRFIRDMVRASGEVILVLGMRKAESNKRATVMAKHEKGRVRDRLSPRSSLVNALAYTPIEDWRNDDVWIYLNQWQNPWGYSNKDLFAMYRGATADNECPLVVDTSTPSCGDSRFGCWVCTMVSQDKSMQAMIQNDEEKEWLQPLLDIRQELDIENDRDKRDFRRIWGQVQLFERNLEGEISIEPIPGPYTKFWREHWVRRVLEAQTQVRKTGPEEMRDITLITQEELIEIRRIWLEEKHEFDDSLPRIYQEVTGTPFEDTRQGVDKKLLGSDEWTVLTEVCEEDEMHLELMARLLDTERQHFTKPRRTGIYGDLEKCFDSSSRDKEKAIDNAHYQRNIKTAVQAVRESDPESLQQVRQALEQTGNPQKDHPGSAGKAKNTVESDANQPKQLSWADVKFAPTNAGDQDTQD